MKGLRLFIQRARLGRGASLLEYGILVALVALISLASVGSLGIGVSDTLDLASRPLNGDFDNLAAGCSGPGGCK